MNYFWKDLIVNLIPALIISSAAIFSVKQFYSQKWWEKKSETYSNISEDLSRLFFCIKELYSESIGEKKLDDHRIDTLNNELRRRLESFKMITAGGAFIVSKEVHKELELLIENLDNNYYKGQKESFADYLGRDYDAIRKFKDSFNELAKRDLNIN